MLCRLRRSLKAQRGGRRPCTTYAQLRASARWCSLSVLQRQEAPVSSSRMQCSCAHDGG